jgi:type III restriction enzyme
MENRFFEHPILNSPYEYPPRHWEMDASGQPTQQIIETRRIAQFITPIPKPRKRKETLVQEDFEFDDETGISTNKQRYEPIPIINEVRRQVDEWRRLPSPTDWLVTPETARLLQHWRHHPFQGIRPFFCQVEAVETAIWLTEVAPKRPAWRRFQEHLDKANADANPELSRLSLKLATGAGKTTVMAMLIAGVSDSAFHIFKKLGCWLDTCHR